MARKSRSKRSKAAKARLYGGRGGYFDKSKNGEVTAIGKALRYLGGLGGGALAPYGGVDPVVGSGVGRSLAAHVSKWLGYGAYKVKANSIMASSNASIPMMHNSSQSVVVRHREYIGDVLSSGNFTKQAEVVLNPGLTTSFPWLATIARQYQEYTWRGMVFHFVPTVGSAVSANVPAFGNVMFHTDYRVTAPAPVSKTELLNEYFASDSRPCDSFIHPIECDPRENPYNVQYVRAGTVATSEDPKSYDLGVFRCFTAGQGADGVALGEIWVTYEVELRKPQVATAIADGSFYKLSGALSLSNTTGTVTTLTDTLGVMVLKSTNNVNFVFPARLIGRFLVAIYYGPTNATFVSTLGTGWSGVNVNVLSVFGGSGTDSSFIANQNGIASGACYSCIVDLTVAAQASTLVCNLAALANCNGGNIAISRLSTW